MQSLADPGLFLHPGVYESWERGVHLLSTGAMAIAAAGVLVWVVARVLLPSVGGVRTAAYALLGLALAATMVALAVVGTAPILKLDATGLARTVAIRIQEDVEPASPQVRVTARAGQVATALRKHLGAYQKGRYTPPLPAGYRTLLVYTVPQSSFAPFLTHGNMAPIADIARQVSQVIDGKVSASAIAGAAAAHEVDVGIASGVGATYDHHLPIVVIVVLGR